MGNINFLKNEIRKIKEQTEINYHSENLLFIAKKLKSPLLKDFQKIHQEHMRIGHLPYELSQKRYKLYEKLMKELKKKSPQFEEVYGSL